MSGRVLVVDDSKVIRQLIRVNLELEGFEVVTATDGAECLEIVHQVRPDVVTLDVVMPRLDGLRTAARLRADARTRHLPIAIVSAGSRCEGEGCEQAVADAFLGKPFEPAELVRVVRRLMLLGRLRCGALGPAGPALAAGAAAPAPQTAPAAQATAAPAPQTTGSGLGSGAPGVGAPASHGPRAPAAGPVPGSRSPATGFGPAAADRTGCGPAGIAPAGPVSAGRGSAVGPGPAAGGASAAGGPPDLPAAPGQRTV